jgi:hypothetical protein
LRWGKARGSFDKEEISPRIERESSPSDKRSTKVLQHLKSPPDGNGSVFQQSEPYESSETSKEHQWAQRWPFGVSHGS